MPSSTDVHPMRFMRTRPFAKAALSTFKKTSFDGMPTEDTLRSVLADMTRDFKASVLRLPFSERPSRAITILSGEVSLATHVAQFTAAGRNILSLGKNLTEALDKTTIEGIRVGDVQMPYDSFYVALDPSFSGRLPGPENRIDGAYISRVRGPEGTVLQVTITTRRLDSTASSSAGWPFTRDLSFYAPLDISNPDRSFSEIVDEAVAKGEIKVSTDMLAPSGALQLSEEELGVVVRDVSHKTARDVAEFNKAALPAFRRTLGLLLGAICYLNSREPGEKLPVAMPSDVPADILAVQGDPKRSKSARQNATRSLLEQGYMTMTVAEIAAPRYANGDGPEGSDGKNAIHWRRGHFRRQPHGEGRQQIRIRWIHPVLVNAPELKEGAEHGIDQDEIPGRIYQL